MNSFAESVDAAALAWLAALGYAVLHGLDFAAGEPGAERPIYWDVLLEARLRPALARLNPDLPPDAIEDAFRTLTRADAPSLDERNRAVHRMQVEGITVEYRRKDGEIAGAQVRVIDFDASASNDWLAVNQLTVSEGQHTRRPDVVLLINGLPLAVIDLINPFVDWTNAGSTETKMPRTSWAEMARFEIAAPTTSIVESFTSVIRPSVDGIVTHVHESRALAALRDALLPTLVSGELRLTTGTSQ